MRDIFVARLAEIAERDPRLMLITGDLGFGVLTEFARRYPSQFLNAGVAEQNMTGLATGMALEGRIVFTYSIANFPVLRCLEQIRNDAAYHDANVKVVSIGGGFSYGALGMSHHATEDLAIMRSLPITIVAPGCDWETAQATTALVRQPGTCYFRLDKSTAGDTGMAGETFELGKARTVRDGADLTIIVTGGILGAVLHAADALSQQGVHCRVVSMHTIQPFDGDTVMDAAATTGGILTVEEHTLAGGLGSAVAEVCMDSGAIPRKFRRLAIRGGLSSIVGSQEFLRGKHGLNAGAIQAAALELVTGAREAGRADSRRMDSFRSAR